MSRSIAIDVAHLGKVYDKVRAVDDLSFQVYGGEIFGLLGPNGAGKSTTLRILITLLQPTSGSATILGLDTVKDADRVRKTIGYVPQERALIGSLRGVNIWNYSRISITWPRTKQTPVSPTCLNWSNSNHMPTGRLRLTPGA